MAVSKHAREQGWSWTDPAPTPDELAARDSDIRAWAESRGIGVTERGRIPSNVVGLYDAARLDRPQELKRDHPSEE
ncbi:Lsr2 family DNA-binding protein [Actinomadura kijaniata]|uniref:Lsr2 family DNA-binding protein n=1 Tax=Actinomadura kijaniata TaxID=46161 RepID=UPI0028ABA9D0|nr:histone-like nucleoid-structuring protein Lsr2 [Actinomadura namibiensis]